MTAWDYENNIKKISLMKGYIIEYHGNKYIHKFKLLPSPPIDCIILYTIIIIILMVIEYGI